MKYLEGAVLMRLGRKGPEPRYSLEDLREIVDVAEDTLREEVPLVCPACDERIETEEDNALEMLAIKRAHATEVEQLLSKIEEIELTIKEMVNEMNEKTTPGHEHGEPAGEEATPPWRLGDPCKMCGRTEEKRGGWENGHHLTCWAGKLVADEVQMHWARVLIGERREVAHERAQERKFWVGGLGAAGLLGAVLGWALRRG